MVSVYGAMTHERKERIWELWQQGQPMSDIARDIGKPSATVYSYLLYHGGIPPRPKIRRANCLLFEERETISRGLASGYSLRRISRDLGRSPSTVSREIARNGGSWLAPSIGHRWQKRRLSAVASGRNGFFWKKITN